MSRPKFHTGESCAVCPFCDHRYEGSWDWDGPDDMRPCDNCGQRFVWARDTIIEYHTSPVGNCQGCGRPVAASIKGGTVYHTTPGTQERCPGTRKPPVYPDAAEGRG